MYLRTYTGWTGSPNKYSQMKYENGEKCWGGPHRSLLVSSHFLFFILYLILCYIYIYINHMFLYYTQVNLVCAESTFINNVSEPNK